MSRQKSKSRDPGRAHQGVEAQSATSDGGDEAEILAMQCKLWGRLLFAAVLATLFLLCCFPLVDTDFWWHLKTGQLIWQNKEIPRIDWYTYKDADRPWIDLHWGFQLLVAGLFSLGGGNLVILFKAAAYTLTAAIGWNTTGSRMPVWLKGIVWVCPLVLLSGRAMERPEMLTMIFLAITLWILHRASDRPGLLWGLVPLQLVWTNCHALFILGLVVIWCFAASQLLNFAIVRSGSATLIRWLGDQSGFTRSPDSTRTGQALLTPMSVLIPSVVATLVCLINPYRFDGILFPFVLFQKFSTSRELYLSIGEFQSPMMFLKDHGFTNINPIALLILSGLTLASFVLLLAKGKFNSLRGALIIGFGWLAWTAVRNQNVFALIAAVVVCGNFDDFVRAGNSQDSVRTGVTPLRLWLCRGVFMLYCVWMLAVVTEVWGLAKWNDGYRRFGLGERNGWFAHDAARAARNLGLPPLAFVSNFGQAAVYTYENGPNYKVFMDPRLEVCSEETYKQYNAVVDWMRKGDPRWMDAIRDSQGRMPVVILDTRNSRTEMQMLLFSPQWRLVFAEPAAALFVEAKVADEKGLPMVDPQPLFYPPTH